MNENLIYTGLDVDDTQYYRAAFDKGMGEIVSFKCRPKFMGSKPAVEIDMLVCTLIDVQPGSVDDLYVAHGRNLLLVPTKSLISCEHCQLIRSPMPYVPGYLSVKG